MQLTDFYHIQDSRILFSRTQASNFAKSVAGDFNPIHDPDAKRFCVPGDLLFAVVLAQSGLHQQMKFSFSGMVGDNLPLRLESIDQAHLALVDADQRVYLSVEANGKQTDDSQLIEQLIRCYVEFSGQTFPHILVPLMAEQDVMINPERPLIIYESMSIDLDRLDIAPQSLTLNQAKLAVNGKRGDVTLTFDISADGERLGRGQKTMVLSGLRRYDQQSMEHVVADYNSNKANYLTSDLSIGTAHC